MLIQEYVNRISAITNTEILGFEEIKTKWDVFKIPKIDGVKFEIKLKEITTKSPENSLEKWIYTVTANSLNEHTKNEHTKQFCEEFGKFYISLQKVKKHL